MMIAKEKTFMLPKNATKKNTNPEVDLETDIELDSRREKIIRFFKKMGFWGFMFFLIKGLVWVAVFLGVGKLFS